jgi:TRAP transporter 4TM/12TM fusion protein
VVASGLFGTISGSAVANVVSTGTFTIPLMKGIGYRPQFAGAVEAVASTGGQFMPPVMAATAFIMADFLGVPYLRVAGAAAIPAILYYFAVYVMIDREALKMNLKALPRDELPRVIKVLNQWYLSLPLWMIIYALLAGYSPMKAGLYAWYVSIGLMVLKGWKRFSIRDFLRAMENGSKNLMPVSITCACAGIIVGMIILTGLGLKISGMVLLLSGGSIFMALLLTAFACLILGMGLPTLPAYLVAVSITIPALAKLGVQPLAAHMFVFYFSIISCITPPVAIAAYAAAAISKSNPMKVGWEAVKLGIAAFLLPFIFVYQPVLLLVGSPWNILNASLSACIGVMALGCAVVGFIQTRLSPWERVSLIVGSVLLIIPGLTTDLMGLAFCGVPYLTQRFRCRGLAVELQKKRGMEMSRNPKEEA